MRQSPHCIHNILFHNAEGGRVPFRLMLLKTSLYWLLLTFAYRQTIPPQRVKLISLTEVSFLQNTCKCF